MKDLRLLMKNISVSLAGLESQQRQKRWVTHESFMNFSTLAHDGFESTVLKFLKIASHQLTFNKYFS